MQKEHLSIQGGGVGWLHAVAHTASVTHAEKTKSGHAGAGDRNLRQFVASSVVIDGTTHGNREGGKSLQRKSSEVATERCVILPHAPPIMKFML
jgi:hypothetical protein